MAPGSRVLVIDDWFETGCQFTAARALITDTGATVAGASVLVDQTTSSLTSTLGKYRFLVRASELVPQSWRCVEAMRQRGRRVAAECSIGRAAEATDSVRPLLLSMEAVA